MSLFDCGFGKLQWSWLGDSVALNVHAWQLSCLLAGLKGGVWLAHVSSILHQVTLDMLSRQKRRSIREGVEIQVPSKNESESESH